MIMILFTKKQKQLQMLKWTYQGKWIYQKVLEIINQIDHHLNNIQVARKTTMIILIDLDSVNGQIKQTKKEIYESASLSEVN